MRRSLPLASPIAAVLALAAAPDAQQLPAGFVAEPIGSGWVNPTALCWLDEERLLVAERDGRVWYVVGDEKRNLVYDIGSETLVNGDRGMLGIAVPPDFDATGWLYLLFVVDVEDGRDRAQLGFSRLIRVRTELRPGGELVALSETREHLIGDSWTSGIASCHLSHTIGSVRFLSDGSLVLATGDNAHYDFTDVGGQDPGCFSAGRTPPDQDIGAFRSQYDDSLCGKVLRLDPATGLGLPDNPFFTGDPADILSRVWARGLRNPFRLTLLPDSGPREALFVADVGWNSWEEIELCTGGENFGWPCWEGLGARVTYQDNDPGGFCDALVQQTEPLIAWHHSSLAAGFRGNCASGLCVYRGERYPEVYRGRLFFSDYGGAWLRAAQLDDDLRVRSVLSFGTQMGGFVELVEQPGTLDLVYAALPSTVARLRYLGLGQPPVARASATPAHGPGDLLVTLSAEGSHDPDGQDLAYSWDLGDGESALGPVVEHAYAGAQTYVARVTVTDSEGLASSAEARVTPNDTPPRIVELVSPHADATFVAGEPLQLVATVADDEEDPAALDVEWTLDLVHDHHVHPDWMTASGASVRVMPEAHGPGDNHFVVRVRVTDSRGLADERSLEVYDRESRPQAHLVELGAARVRAGQMVSPIGHVEFSLGRALAKQARLTWDWGDGSLDVFEGSEHQVDTRPTHAYAAPGTYKLRLVAEIDGSRDVEEASIEVVPARPAVAVFAALEAERWVPLEQQVAIVDALRAALASRTSEVREFNLGQGGALAAWMESLRADALQDVLVLLDFVPAPLVEGGVAGSLLERWIEGGNLVVWSGTTPLQEVLADDGSVSQTFLGADELFGSTIPFITAGNGNQARTALGALVVPSLPAYRATRALRVSQLGPEWRVARLFASDEDGEADAVELEHASRGAYAQFLCAEVGGLPRPAVLREYLLERLGKSRFGAAGAASRR